MTLDEVYHKLAQNLPKDLKIIDEKDDLHLEGEEIVYSENENDEESAKLRNDYEEALKKIDELQNMIQGLSVQIKNL